MLRSGPRVRVCGRRRVRPSTRSNRRWAASSPTAASPIRPCGSLGTPNPDGAIRTEPKWTIATKSRDQAAGVDNSPGPIYDLPPAAVERQVAGHKKSAPRPMFSRYSRWAKLEKELRSNTVPGPGHYG